MDESKITDTLKNFKPKPSVAWQQSFLNSISNLEESVTPVAKSRNSILNVFNFLILFNMSAKLKVAISMVSVVAILAAGGGAVYASEDANPGGFLYPLDKAVESVERAFTSDPVKEAELELDIMGERVLELEELSEGDDTEAIADSITEVEAQQQRLQEKLQEMDQLRSENKLQTQEQQRVMEQLQEKIQEHEGIMTQVQTKLQSNGDSSNSDSLEQVQNKYSEEMGNQIQNFEEETGAKIQESEQNQGEETQIQNQNQGEETPQYGNDSGQNSQQQGRN